MIEKTLVILKPDAVEKGVDQEILARIESAGMEIVRSRRISMTLEQAESLYAEHKTKPFYQGLVDFALSGPCVVAMVSGENAVQQIRTLIGATDPAKASLGTIRYDYGRGQELPKNMIHASDSPESAEREIPIFFPEGEASSGVVRPSP